MYTHTYTHTLVKNKGRAFLHGVKWQPCRCFLNHFYLFALRRVSSPPTPHFLILCPESKVSFSIFWEKSVVALKTRANLCGLFVFLSLNSPCGPRLAPYLVPKLPPYLLLRVPLCRPQGFLLPHLSFADPCCFIPRLC